MRNLIKKLEEQKEDLVKQIAEITNEYSGRPLTPEELELYYLRRSVIDEYLRQLENYGKKKE